MKSIRAFIPILAIASVLAVAGPPAHAQVVPKKTTTLTLSDSSIAAASTEVSTSQAFTINARSGFGIVATFVAAGAGTSNVTFAFSVSLDGTTWTTLKPFSAAFAANGTTPVVGFYNFPPNVAGGGASNIAYVRLATIQNAIADQAVTITSVVVTRDSN